MTNELHQLLCHFCCFFINTRTMWAGEWESPAPNDAKDFRLSLVLNEQHSPPFRLALLPCFMSRTGIDASEFRKRLSSSTSKRKERAITLKKKKKMTWSPYCTCELYCLLWPSYKILYKGISFVLDFVQLFFFFFGFCFGSSRMTSNFLRCPVSWKESRRFCRTIFCTYRFLLLWRRGPPPWHLLLVCKREKKNTRITK